MTDLSRRAFSTAALGVAALATGLAGVRAEDSRPAPRESVSARDRKEWARDNFKGIANILPPSYTPDFSGVDEAGVRRDVRLAIQQGFFATLCSQYTVGLTVAEQKHVVEAACREAKGEIQVGTSIIAPLETAIDLVQHAERCGCSHVLLIAPPALYKESEDALYEFYDRVAQTTSLAIVVQYYNDRLSRKWHPAGLSMKVFDRLADIPNVVAMKLTQIIDPGLAFELAEKLGNRILIGSAYLGLVPLLTRACRMQWSGMFATDCVQAPSAPNAVEFMRHVAAGNMDRAMTSYWRLQPAEKAFYALQAPSLAKGGHPWNQIKYAKWLIGGNGGLIRNPSSGENAGLLPVVNEESMPTLDAKTREAIRDVYRNMGATMEQRLEEEFLVGREAYAKGVRAADLKDPYGYS